jgi:gluconolactonase
VDEGDGVVGVFRKPSNHRTATSAIASRLVTCEHDSRRVTRTEYDGTATVLMDRFENKRLNSPNDVVVKSDDSVWFTDPPFGILGNYEGHVAPVELPTNVYRLDSRTGQATGRRRHPAAQRPLLARREPALRGGVGGDAARDPHLRRGRQRHRQPTAASSRRGGGIPDGMRCDTDGNLWCGWAGARA